MKGFRRSCRWAFGKPYLGGKISYIGWRHGGHFFANFWQTLYIAHMSTMNVSLPEALKSFVDEQVRQRGYGTSSEYVRELIRRDQDRLQLRGLLLAGARSQPSEPVTPAYFDGLRAAARQAANKA